MSVNLPKQSNDGQPIQIKQIIVQNEGINKMNIKLNQIQLRQRHHHHSQAEGLVLLPPTSAAEHKT
jgi:hypothetical protein